MSQWMSRSTGKPVSRVDIINDFERETGIKLSAEEFQALLDELTRQEEEANE